MRQTLTLEQKFEAVKGVSPEWERVKHFTWSDLTGMRDELAKLRADNKALLDALRSIAANTCCDSCREAALVARAAIEQAERP